MPTQRELEEMEQDMFQMEKEQKIEDNLYISYCTFILMYSFELQQNKKIIDIMTNIPICLAQNLKICLYKFFSARCGTTEAALRA